MPAREGPDNDRGQGPHTGRTARRLTVGRLNLIRTQVKHANEQASWRPQFVSRLPAWHVREQMPLNFTKSLQ